MNIQKRSVLPLLVGLASLVLIVAGLRAISELLSPILLSLFLVLVTHPMLKWLRGRGVPGWLAYVLVVIGVIAVGLVFILFLAVSLSQLSSELPSYSRLIEQQVSSLVQWLAKYDIESDDILALDWFQPERIFQVLFSFVASLLGTVSNVGLTLLIFIYMLASADHFSARLDRALAGNAPLLERFKDFASSVGTYLLIKSGLGTMTALSQIVLMWILGIDFAVLWGVFSFLFNFVPNIGFYIALLPPLLITVITLGWFKAIILAVGYTLINNFFDMVIAPRYLGKGLDLSVLVTFLAVLLWAWIFGPIGAFMALPLTVMMKKLILETFADTQLLGLLIRSGAQDEDDS